MSWWHRRLCASKLPPYHMHLERWYLHQARNEGSWHVQHSLTLWCPWFFQVEINYYWWVQPKQEIELANRNLLYEGHIGFHVYRIHETTENVVSYTLYNDINIFYVSKILTRFHCIWQHRSITKNINKIKRQKCNFSSLLMI